MHMQFLNNKFSGVIIGGAYAFLIRILFSNPVLKDGMFKFSLFSITFIWIVPILIGAIPIIFAPKDKKISIRFSIWSPVVSVLLFFLIAFLSHIEDIICLWILAIPFVTGAIIGGITIRAIVVHNRKKKGYLYSLLLVPALSSLVEGQFKTPVQRFSYSNSVTISATPQAIWPNIIRVREIKENEYRKGFFYYAGIPRPLYATLDTDAAGGIRIGHFGGGLRFIERVATWEPNQKISFDITVDETSIGNSVFDNHILRGGRFRFVEAAYQLQQTGPNTTLLTLKSTYELNSKINGYASYWGQILLNDFQGRLLEVIKQRCDAQ